MDEKVIIEAKSNKLNIFLIIVGLVAVAFIVLGIDMALAGDSNTWLWFAIALGCIIVDAVIFGAFSNCKIIVTDKRIFGRVVFGRTIDLPLDSISAIATTSITKGVSVSTSSGRITFFFLPKRKDISNEIRNLLIKRQDNPAATVHQEISSADELKKFKELLDSGVITQEEFDAKKKQLLGL